MNSQLMVRTGACVQAAWHSMRSSENVPSAVTSSFPTPSSSVAMRQNSSPPSIPQPGLTHTPMWYSPMSWRLYIV